MTEQAQIKALAELDGETNLVMTALGDYKIVKDDSYISPKPYIISYDAIIPLRRKVLNKQELKVAWLNHARAIVGRRCAKNKVGTVIVSDFDIACIEPIEDCEALLRATDKWKD